MNKNTSFFEEKTTTALNSETWGNFFSWVLLKGKCDYNKSGSQQHSWSTLSNDFQRSVPEDPSMKDNSYHQITTQWKPKYCAPKPQCFNILN